MIGDASVSIVSLVIPTLNSARVLPACLDSIRQQAYDIGAAEVLVVDAGSTDGTQSIAAEHGATILHNPLRTAEAGKVVGMRAASGDIVAFVDSDNILVGDDWLDKMLWPFIEPDIVASEPIRYVARPNDGYITRYFAHLGMGDPVCLFLGNYDRYSVLTRRWTDMPVRTACRPGYDKVWLRAGALSTLGANGFLVRRRMLQELDIDSYFFDVDIVHQLVTQERWAFAKVHCGIVHTFAGDVRTFRRKQRRRIRDFLHYRKHGLRALGSQAQHHHGL